MYWTYFHQTLMLLVTLNLLMLALLSDSELDVVLNWPTFLLPSALVYQSSNPSVLMTDLMQQFFSLIVDLIWYKWFTPSVALVVYNFNWLCSKCLTADLICSKVNPSLIHWTSSRCWSPYLINRHLSTEMHISGA